MNAKLTLPLVDHPLDTVIQDQTFHTNVVLRHSGEFHGSDAERGVAVNIYNNLVRCANFATNRSRETEAHRLHFEYGLHNTCEIWCIALILSACSAPHD